MNIAVIPARGNSKGIPRKNMKLLGGKPLIEWTLETALASKKLDWIIVDSEDDEILSCARDVVVEQASDINVLFHTRKAELSQDKVQLSEVVLAAVRWFEFNYTDGKEKIFTVTTLAPTSPFRPGNIIDVALTSLAHKGVDGVVSARNCGYTYSDEGSYFPNEYSPIGHDPLYRVGRQYGTSRTADTFEENGSVYTVTYRHLTERACVRPPADSMSLVIMDHWRYSIDIDNNDDWELAEYAAEVYYAN